MPDLHLTIPRLAVGESALVEADGYTVLVERVAEATPARPALPVVGHTVVDIIGDATRVHAAALRLQPSGQRRRDDYTLCGSGRFKAFRVTRRRDDLPLSVVTCSRCRKRLHAADIETTEPEGTNR